METPINAVIKKFEELKDKTFETGNLKDVIYLDGVLAVLDTFVDYEKKFLKKYKNEIRKTKGNN